MRKEADAAKARARSAPDDPLAVGALGMRYYALDFPLAAAACFERAASLDPGGFRWLYDSGLAWEKAGEGPRAIAALERATALDPSYGPALDRLADLLAGQDPARAGSLYRRALALDARDAAAHVGLGRLARAAGRGEEALGHFRHAIAIVPDYAEAHYGIAMLLVAARKPEEAGEHLRRHSAGGTPPLSTDPLRRELVSGNESAAVLRRQAAALEGSGELAGAVELLEKSVTTDESGSTSHIHLGVVLARQGQFEKAAQQFRLALAGDPGNIEAKSSLGLALADLKQYEEAERLYREVLSQHPGHGPTSVYLGQLLTRTGRQQEALPLLQRGVEAQPANGMFQYALGDLLARSGRHGEAVTHLRKASSLLPGNAGIRLALGTALARTGDPAGGREQLLEAVRLAPGLAEAHAQLAGLALTGRDPSAAVAWAEKACALTKNAHVPYLERLAEAYEAAGRSQDAARTRTLAQTARGGGA